MIRVKNTEFITDSEEHVTMQDSSSTVSFTPSFSFYASGDNDLVQAAVRAVRESESYYSAKVDGNDDAEFEFETLPLREESFFHFPTTTKFKRSFDDDVGVAADRVMSKDIFFGGWNITIDPSPPSPSQSHSSSGNITPRRCFWSPITSPARGDRSKSKSPRRCRLKDLLRRSHSDGAASTSSASKRCLFKGLLRRSHSDGGGDGCSISTSGNGPPTVTGKNKTASNKLEVERRRKCYLPYRQDLIGVFAGRSRRSCGLAYIPYSKNRQICRFIA